MKLWTQATTSPGMWVTGITEFTEVEMKINVGDTVTYNDIASDPGSFLRTGIVEAVEHPERGGILLTLHHPDRTHIRWTEWYRADFMTVTRGA